MQDRRLKSSYLLHRDVRCKKDKNEIKNIKFQAKNHNHLYFLKHSTVGQPLYEYTIWRLAQIETETCVAQYSVRKKTEQRKGLISHMWMICYFKCNLSLPCFVPKFQNPKSREIFDGKFSMHYIGVRDGKKERNNEGKTNYKHLDFLIHNKPGHPLGKYRMWKQL